MSDNWRAVDYWTQAHDEAAGVEPEDELSRVFLSRSWGGRGRLDGDLDPETSSLVETALDRLMSEMVEDTPRAELGSASVLRAEALGEMARRLLDTPDTPTDHGNRSHLTL